MKTTPPAEQLDLLCEERYDYLRENWQRPEADKFGTWYDWTEDDVQYLVRELANGNYDDDFCEKGQGGNNIIACALLNMVEVSNRTTEAPKLPDLIWHLEHVVRLTLTDAEERVENPIHLDKLRRILTIITEPCEPSIFDELPTHGTPLH